MTHARSCQYMFKNRVRGEVGLGSNGNSKFLVLGAW